MCVIFVLLAISCDNIVLTKVITEVSEQNIITVSHKAKETSSQTIRQVVKNYQIKIPVVIIILQQCQICAKIIDMLLMQYFFLNLADPDGVKI